MSSTFQLAEGEKLYRVGVNPKCPVHSVTLGGQNFTRRSEKVTGHGGETLREPMDGSIVIMQPGQLERCMEAATHKVIRSTRGRKVRSRVVDKRTKGFRNVAGDTPVADWVYAEEVVQSNNPHADHRRATFADRNTKTTEARHSKKARASR